MWDENSDNDEGFFVSDEYFTKFDLPLSIYGLKTLEALKLFSCNFDASMFKSFGSLRHLSLGRIELSSSSLKALVENCAVLESLSLKRCWNTGVIEIKGASLRLESLSIDKCHVIHSWITIEAPNLRFFKYCGEFCTFELNSTGRIDEVVLDFGLQSEFGEVGPLLSELFRDFYAAKVLTVCSFILQAIPTSEEPLGLKPCLHVKHLILKTAMHENELYGVRFFLNSCPYLETLTIDIDPAKRIFEVSIQNLINFLLN
ncbi:putative F-box/LRR-repeat protein At5g54820 [Morus notabilis]|uniref:putative F-box/LRR-repeat protein At5g54820 n=1 Tax=Morus notabilis TaxID=981085 RepID=UPI000CED6BB1|nr:putative F-box/LRR-repeat protein At5g54820 [Morus notabilis]